MKSKYEKSIKTIRDDIKEIYRLINKLTRDKQSRSNQKCCIPHCTSTILFLFGCKKCCISRYICKPHFSRRSITRICPVCNTKSICKDWLNPPLK